MAFNQAGVLYGVDLVDNGTGGAAHLITINTTTGLVTDLGASVNALDAIAFAGQSVSVPTLSPTILVLLGLLLAGAAIYLVTRRS